MTDTITVEHGTRDVAVTIEEPHSDGRRLPAVLAVQDLAGGAAERHRLGSPEAERYARIPEVRALIDGWTPTYDASDPVPASAPAPAEKWNYDLLAAALRRHDAAQSQAEPSAQPESHAEAGPQSGAAY